MAWSETNSRSVKRTSSRVPRVSSGSLNITDLPAISNLMFLRDDGVGVEANGYSLGSRSLVARGGFITSGGKLVVVVVVVVTTVVRVAGAKENWPSEVPETTFLKSVVGG